jgi:hypothetical protein
LFEIGKDKVQDFIQSLPKVLNQTAMSTYDMIVKDAESKAQKAFEEFLVIERQRAEEEERQRTNNTILNLHQIAKMSNSEIALMTGAEIEYVEALIAKMETDKAN